MFTRRSNGEEFGFLRVYCLLEQVPVDVRSRFDFALERARDPARNET